MLGLRSRLRATRFGLAAALSSSVLIAQGGCATGESIDDPGFGEGGNAGVAGAAGFSGDGSGGAGGSGASGGTFSAAGSSNGGSGGSSGFGGASGSAGAGGAGGAAGTSGFGGASGSGGTGGTAGAGGGSCAAPTADCDGSPGCEVDHAQSSNSCAAAENLGAHCGDLDCGSTVFDCSVANWLSHSNKKGKSSRWFRSHANECAGCCSDVEARITLSVPPGVNYDLHAWSACGSLVASSANPAGQSEQLQLFIADDCFGSDSGFDYIIEVRYVSGSSCSDWTLDVQKSSC